METVSSFAKLRSYAIINGFRCTKTGYGSEIRINYLKDREETAYYTDSLDDALGTLNVWIADKLAKPELELHCITQLSYLEAVNELKKGNQSQQ